MSRYLLRVYSPVFLLDGLLERRLNVFNVLYLRTSSVQQRNLRNGDSKVIKLFCNPCIFGGEVYITHQLETIFKQS